MRRILQTGRRQRRRAAMSGITGVAVALVLASCGTSTALQMAPTAYLAAATRTTLARSTADVTLSGSIDTGGRTVEMTGTGTADFSTNAVTMDMSTQLGPGRTFEIRELLVDGTMYVGMVIDGQSLKQATGRDWIRLSVPIACASAGGASSDPVDQLRLLAAKGGSVSSLGTSVIGGRRVQGFSYAPSRQQALARLDTIASKCGLTPAQQATARTAFQAGHLPSSKVWFSTDQLLRRMQMVMSMPSSAGGTPTDENVTMDFSNYGAQVDITPPASSDVMSEQQFQAFANAQGGGTSPTTNG